VIVPERVQPPDAAVAQAALQAEKETAVPVQLQEPRPVQLQAQTRVVLLRPDLCPESLLTEAVAVQELLPQEEVHPAEAPRAKKEATPQFSS
jgi:hypothetical protein